MSANLQVQWACERCTFINEGLNLTCTMCFLTRTDAKDLPVQWEWRANPDQWIPYDLASSSELENAYQNNLAVLNPKQGYFASIPDRYEIRFNYATRRFQQQNITSGGVRRIRRIANDDNSILQPVSFEDVTAEDTCIICLDSFVDPDTTTSDQHVVKLPPCHGHYFHRVCVAAAIKLRDECPMCKKRVDY
ncbi:17578_t:CDS:2 [Dentiscutata erythropus]|uniref:17578_t:CDS:1 n=1 Tax=Dentiscutata erythropus TaxID=1348616 RepID=A0A9N8ZPF0_9GLOM|nr:17578_t:CDS:2 [Dentiscutata erythropus]